MGLGNPAEGEDVLREFFPANRESFIEKAGEVACITAADLEDEHKRRHLDSFQKSMTAWKCYEEATDGVEDSVKEFARQLLEGPEIRSESDLDSAIRRLRKVLKCNPSKAQLGAGIEIVRDPDSIEQNQKYRSLDRLLLRRAVRTSSGVAVITVLTSPGKFSCAHDCWYCPNEPGQPRSYLSTEPAVLRGNQCHWDAAIQFWDRARTLHRNRHTVDKIEILVLGGTWSGYSQEYRRDFCRDLFYAANEFRNLMTSIDHAAVDTYPPEELLKKVRQRLSLEEEQILNESSSMKIIGLTLETRPDYINPAEIKNLRMYGCTRVQLGVQHTDDGVLSEVNRGHSIDDVRRALHLLKSSCYKVDIHLMPDLPNSTPILDQYMFDQVLRDCSLQADQWKIYPCEVTPFTKISEWYKDGIYVPYTELNIFEPGTPGTNIFDCVTTGEEVLIGLILQTKKCMHPWIRLNRVIRDIPNQSIIAGNSKTNLRQILEQIARAHGWTCACMRCREVRKNEWIANDADLIVRAYRDVDATEYFLSFENNTRSTIYGFLRLRIPDFLQRERAAQNSTDTIPSDIENYRATEDDLPFDCLKGRSALIRELHVYGVLVGTEERIDDQNDTRTQHVGVGSALMRAAETLACCKGATKIVIIAGVGTRNYYRKFDYKLSESYMVRDISTDEAKADIFTKWAVANQLVKNVDCINIEHINLEELPSLRNVKVDYQIVHNVLTGQKGEAGFDGTKATVSYRAFLSHWAEVISIPKMKGDADEPSEILAGEHHPEEAKEIPEEVGEQSLTSVEEAARSEPPVAKVFALSTSGELPAPEVVWSGAPPSIPSSSSSSAKGHESPRFVSSTSNQADDRSDSRENRHPEMIIPTPEDAIPKTLSSLRRRKESSHDADPSDQPDTFAAPNTRASSVWDGWSLDAGTIGALGVAGLSFALGIYFGRRAAR